MDPITVSLPLGAVETTMLAGVRFAAFLVVAPPFSQRAVPGTVRVVLALGLALAVAPRLTAAPSGSTGEFVGSLVLQALVGGVLGVLVAVVFAVVQSAGSLIDLFGGFQLAAAFDPASLTHNAPFGRLYQTTAIMLLFASDAYHVVLTGLVRTFDALPLGAPVPTGPVAEQAVTALSDLFLAALQVAGPMLVVLFLADVGLGLLTRVAPALNAFAIGFPLKILLVLVIVGMAYAALPGIVESLTGTAVETMWGVLP